MPALVRKDTPPVPGRADGDRAELTLERRARGGAHFAGTSAGRVLSADDGYRFVPETRTRHLLRLRGQSSSCIARVRDSADHRVHSGSQAGHERLPLHRAAGMSRIDGHGMRVGNLFGYPPLVPRRDDPVTQRY